MRVIFLGCLVSFLAAVPAFSDNGIPNSRCRLAITNQSMPAPWRVDDDVNERIDFGLSSASLANMDVERQVDSALQQLARIARGKLASKMVYNGGECQVDDSDHTPCIEAMTNLEDSGPCEEAQAYASCGSNGCNVVLCQDQSWDDMWINGQFSQVVAHEIGHTYGLGHIDAGNEAGESCLGDMSNSASFCGGSDGCDGELMCTRTGCGLGAFATNGDAQSLRDVYGNAFLRPVHWGRDVLTDGVSNPTRDPAGFTATFAPRMDCASSATPINDCAAVVAIRSSSLSQIRVMKMNTNGPSGSWSSVVSVNFGDTAIHPPDIAVNDDGSVAWITYVNTSNVTIVRRIALGTGTSVPVLGSTLSLSTVSGALVRPVLPPRIEYQDGSVFALIANAVETSFEVFKSPRFRLVRINDAATAHDFVNLLPSGTGIDIDSSSWSDVNFIRNEYDFTCRQSGILARCVIVASINSDEAVASIDSKLRSIAFTVDGLPTALLSGQLQSANWITAVDTRTNGIIGVPSTATTVS